MILQTQRLNLRRPRPEDARDYARIHNSYFVLRYNAMNPTTAQRMETVIQDPQYQQNTLYLEEKATGTLIGAIFLEEDSLRYGVASRGISYFVREESARQGYMKEALQALIGDLFTREKLTCISARVFAPNTASRALLRSLGFQENGIIPHCVKGYQDVIFDDVIHTLFSHQDPKGA